MADITRLILDEHAWFRTAFAELDETLEIDQLSALWTHLESRLELHARAEETVFYPNLLDTGDDAEDETDDAISDHNSIRAAAHRARAEATGSDTWWKAVDDARVENSKHMGEEERGALADFRRNTDAERRLELGVQFASFLAQRTTIEVSQGYDGPDPDAYIAEHS